MDTDFPLSEKDEGQNMPGKKIESVFLDDVPCYEDSAFEIHNKVADAIVDEIENNSPANIAILGEWGSGKSTVLNYVKAKLDSDAIFFTFDAWAHSGDSLRRNFIESLNAAIIAAHEVGQSDESEAKKLVERLRTESQSITERMYGTETITSTSEQSSLKPIPASLLIAAGIFIFFNTCLNAMAPILKGIAVSLSIIPAGINYELAQFIPAVSFLLSCIVWYFAYKYISESYQDNSRKASKSDDEKKRFRERFALLFNELAGFFSKQVSDTATTTKTESSPILDSRMLEDLFNETLALTDKKIIIAFDNLDRLDYDEILSVWSTLQIFSNHNTGTEGGRRAWLILPITRAVFAELEGLNHAESNKSKKHFASLSKLFIRNFEIPAPISTEWKNYFFAQARVSFPAIDDDTLAHVYAIASHSLLSMELRTPRNAKRFLNSMVAESKVFSSMDLKSIAAYCYLRDAYNMEKREESFFNYMIGVINGEATESFYLRSLENQNPGLKSDLAMMAFGQLAPEKASEVFVYAKVNGVIAHGKDIDISELVNDSSGSWETINRIIEDEVVGMTWDNTPSWVFRLLESLDPEAFSFKPSDNVMRNRLAQTLVGGIAEIEEETFRGAGRALAHYLCKSRQDIVIGVEKALINEIEALLGVANEERRANDSRDRAVGFIREAYPVFQVVFEYSEDAKFSLVSSLDSVDFGGLYDDLLSIAVERCCQDYSNTWLADRPPLTLNEVCGALRNIQPSIEAGELDYGGISIIRKSGLPSLEDISSEEIDYLMEQLDISSETTNDWRLSIWELENLCDLSVPYLGVLIDDTPFAIENYAEYSDDSPAPQKLAIVMLAIGSEIGLDEDDETSEVIVRIFDSECIQFARENEFDLFAPLVDKSKDTNSAKTAKWMLKEYWDENDSRTRDIEDCFAYAHIFNTPADRRKLGRELSSFQRIDELMKKDFCLGYSSIYLGALEKDNKNEGFKEWIIDGFKALTPENWERVLSGDVSPNVFPLLERASIEKQSFPNLDKCIVSVIELDAPVKYDVCVLLDNYQPDFDMINAGITSEFFVSKDNVKTVIKAYGLLMHRTNWIMGLSPSQRYEAVQNIIDSKTGYCLKWLVDDIGDRNNPKGLLKGHVREVKKKLSHNAGLRVAKEYKNVARELKNLLS